MDQQALQHIVYDAILDYFETHDGVAKTFAEINGAIACAQLELSRHILVQYEDDGK